MPLCRCNNSNKSHGLAAYLEQDVESLLKWLKCVWRRHIEVACQGKNSSKYHVKLNQCKVLKYDSPNFKRCCQT